MLVDSDELCLTKALEWPTWWGEDVRRSPIYQLWSGFSATANVLVVVISLQFRNAVIGGVGPIQPGEAAARRSEELVELKVPGVEQGTLILLLADPIEGLAIDVILPELLLVA